MEWKESTLAGFTILIGHVGPDRRAVFAESPVVYELTHEKKSLGWIYVMPDELSGDIESRCLSILKAQAKGNRLRPTPKEAMELAQAEHERRSREAARLARNEARYGG